MKVFISHKKEDEIKAVEVLSTLKAEKIDAYLDLLDDYVSNDGEKLTKHIRQKLRECTHAIVIISTKTKESWWVPFEIGMATEKDMPIVNYLVDFEYLPKYLEYWPQLKSLQDVSKYVKAGEEISQEILLEKSKQSGYYQKVKDGVSETERFYKKLKDYLSH